MDDDPWCLGILCFFFVVSCPQFLLDYNYQHFGTGYFFPNSKYVFFFTTLVAAIVLAAKIDWEKVVREFPLWPFAACSTLLLTGVLFSSKGMDDLKTFLVWVLVSLSAMVTAIWCFQQKKWSTLLILLLIALPFSLTVVASLLAELNSYLQVLPNFQNPKHEGYTPERWYMLHTSANGFGLDAALLMILSLSSLVLSKVAIWRACFIFFFTLSLIGLFFSGTRAAIGMAIVAVALCFFAIPKNSLGRAFLLAVIVLPVMSSLWMGLDGMNSYFRVGTDLNTLSSGRYQAYLDIFALAKSSPFVGLGFGAADNSFPVIPSNLFFPSIVAEIGVVGALGAFGICLLPVIQVFFNVMKSGNRRSFFCDDELSLFCLTYLGGSVVWLSAEFDIFRVSASNQLFLFALVFLLLKAREPIDESANKHVT